MLSLNSLIKWTYQRPEAVVNRRLLVDEYEARDPDGGDGLWCPVAKDFILPLAVKAAHIVPIRLGQKRMDTSFGLNSAHDLFSARNGLLLHSSIEEKFDRHLLVIVPDAPIPADGPILRWRLRVLDQTILDQTVADKLYGRSTGLYPITYHGLDGKHLGFRSATRPAARYLYFHYVVALLRVRRHNRHCQSHRQTAKFAWAPPGRYMLRNMMLALAESVGDAVDPESRIFWPHVIEDSIEPSPSTRIFAHQCVRAKLLHRSSGDEYSNDGSDDNDDDDEEVWDENHYDH